MNSDGNSEASYFKEFESRREKVNSDGVSFNSRTDDITNFQLFYDFNSDQDPEFECSLEHDPNGSDQEAHFSMSSNYFNSIDQMGLPIIGIVENEGVYDRFATGERAYDNMRDSRVSE